jgi:hypothetical protein
MGKTLDCSHGWRAPATFDACYHSLGRAHACSHFALGHAHIHVADVIAELRNSDCRKLKQLYKITVFLGAT